MAKTRNPAQNAGKQDPKKKGDPQAQRGRQIDPEPSADKTATLSNAPRPPGMGMDEISAHLDRGWDLLQQGDFQKAKLSAARVIELDENSPESYTLLGAISAASGDADQAILYYQRAMDIDPEFIDPVLYAAEAYMWPLGDFVEAVRLCQRALDLAEEEDEYLDAILLKAEAELGMGDEDSAQATMAELPEIDLPEPIYHLRAARTFLDMARVEEAESHYKKALQRDPQLADAVHGLGLCAEESGDIETMVKQFQKVRELDMNEDPASWALSPDRFEEVCTRAVADLPDRIRKLLANVPVVAADYPSEELVKDGTDPRALGFFTGVPYPQQPNVGGAPHLECIFLYQRNIERIARTPEEVEDEIGKTLVHEAGHFFGLSEEDLERMGLA